VTRLYLALIVVVTAAVYWSVQSRVSLPASAPPPQPPRALPEPLRTHVRSERFDAVTSIRGLPLGVRDALQRLFAAQTLDIADPGARFDAGGKATDPPLPIRRLAAAGCSTDHCVVYYERGGSPPTWQVALFHWTPASTQFEWGASAPGGVGTIDDVLKAIVSGAINRPNSIW
jgi:hypothetical protein